MQFSGWPRALHLRPPPTLGQDNEDILRNELRIDQKRYTELVERQIIGHRPSFM